MTHEQYKFPHHFLVRTELALLGVQENVKLSPFRVAVAPAGRPSALIFSESPFPSVAEIVYSNNEPNVRLNIASSTLNTGARFSKIKFSQINFNFKHNLNTQTFHAGF